jgi:alpha-glucosidase
MLELAAFGPVFLIETAACLEGQAALHGLMASAAMYGMLHPYRRQCAELWRRTGIPFWHHPAMRYPGESGLWDLDDQFMSGPDLLIAPRTGASKGNEGTCRRICLPDDEWIHLWTSRKYRKGWTVVADPPGKPAVFYRARSPFAGLFDELRKKATRF